jgi:hypothetical protein
MDRWIKYTLYVQREREKQRTCSIEFNFLPLFESVLGPLPEKYKCCTNVSDRLSASVFLTAGEAADVLLLFGEAARETLHSTRPQPLS